MPDGLDLTISDGVEIRACTDSETTAVLQSYPRFTPVKQNGKEKVFCIAAPPDERSNWLHVLPLLLFDEIQVHSSPKIKIKDGEFRVAGSITRYPNAYARDHLPQHLVVNRQVTLDKNTMEMLRLLKELHIEKNPFVGLFADAWTITPNSPFRILAFISLVEGMISSDNTKSTGSENISTKMEYFYREVWPSLKSAEYNKVPSRANGSGVPPVL